MTLLKQLMFFLNGGWERCSPPNWFNAYKQMHKTSLGRNFRFKGKTFYYRAIYSGNVDSLGSSESRFISAYKFYRKKK